MLPSEILADDAVTMALCGLALKYNMSKQRIAKKNNWGASIANRQEP